MLYNCHYVVVQLSSRYFTSAMLYTCYYECRYSMSVEVMLALIINIWFVVVCYA